MDDLECVPDPLRTIIMAADLEYVPGLLCGQTYRDSATEIGLAQYRDGEVTPWSGCEKPMAWVMAYRCRQCGRWMHGYCLDQHFGEKRR